MFVPPRPADRAPMPSRIMPSAQAVVVDQAAMPHAATSAHPCRFMPPSFERSRAARKAARRQRLLSSGPANSHDREDRNTAVGPPWRARGAGQVNFAGSWSRLAVSCRVVKARPSVPAYSPVLEKLRARTISCRVRESERQIICKLDIRPGRYFPRLRLVKNLLPVPAGWYSSTRFSDYQSLPRR